jgi:gamma-glutamylcyclotransferase (GGCT)/AIG2-like uncharacterized protein YtfP
MHWWNDIKLRGHLDAALAHCNEASDKSDLGEPTRACELCFHALNKYWTALNQHVDAFDRSDMGSFRETLLTLPADAKAALLDDANVQNLIALSPPVMNHDKLKTRGYVPGQEITGSMESDATKDHRQVQNAFKTLMAGHSESAVDGVLAKLANLLYVIRSNIMHGEKTPYGPDLEKAERDRLVSITALPVQRLILDMLLDRPSRRLAAYGTLQPGGPNSHLLDACGGVWESCTINGEVTTTNGLLGFRYRPGAPSVPAKLLTSPRLPQFWEELDRFEGQEYVRHLVPVQLEDTCVVASVYAQSTVRH